MQKLCIVDTPSGKVCGQSDGRVRVFKGIRYGATGGRRGRFRRASSCIPWAGVRDASAYGAMSHQLPFGWALPRLLEDLIIPTEMSEDCLYLNIWSPDLREAGAGRPVMVWLHGGGFTSGSGASAIADGQRLAEEEGVIVVAINHRLNIFGHLYLDESWPEAFRDAANIGLLDIVLALEWIRDHIGAFGGDPGNLTVWGESGGGGKVAVLLAMREARGLFHKAIIQSGPLLRAASISEAATITERVFRHLELAPHARERILELPAEALVEAFSVARRPDRSSWLGYSAVWTRSFAPVADGRSLAGHPFFPGGSAYADGIPLIVGCTADEIYVPPSSGGLSESEACRQLADLDIEEEKARELLKALHQISPQASHSELICDIASQLCWRMPAITQAGMQSRRSGAPVYAYLFAARVRQADGSYRSTHATDVPFVFDRVRAKFDDLEPALTRDGQPLAARMRASWAKFARTGDPALNDMPWPAHTCAQRSTAVLAPQCSVQADPCEDPRLSVLSEPDWGIAGKRQYGIVPDDE